MSDLFGSNELDQLAELDDSGVDSSESIKDLRDQTGLVTAELATLITHL